MKPARRKLLRLAAGAAALPTLSRIARAQAYPTRPITMIVPLPAGTATDSVGRIMAERMRDVLGQPIVVENVTGADGSLALGRLARAKPDGYTIDVGTIGPHVLNGALYSLRYDLLNDFAPISPVFADSFVLYARQTIPANNLNELVAWLKANPDKASAGFNAPAPRLMATLFQKATETHFALVPYRGAAAQDLVASQIDLLFDTTARLALVRAGSIKAYATTNSVRLALAPDIPTFGEMGLPALFSSFWGGLFAPKGTPKDVISKLNAAAVEALADPAVRSRLVALGAEVFPRDQQTPEALGALVKADAAKWWPLIKEFGIKAE